MPEFAWGGIFALTGALIGFVGTYIVNRLQIDARTKEVNLQLGHQEREARANRLVEVRKTYLIPLREIISKWLVSVSKAQVTRIEAAGVKAAKGTVSGFTDEEIEDVLQYLLRKVRSSFNLQIMEPSQLVQIRAQNSDHLLDRLLTEAQFSYLKASSLALEVARQLENDDKVHTMGPIDKQFNDAIDELRGRLIAVNGRIEELLSGEPRQPAK